MKTFKWSSMIACILLLMFASSCAKIQDPSQANTRRKLDVLAQNYMAKYRSPGMIIAVWVPGKGEYVVPFGTSDIKNKQPLADSDRFRIGSNSKIFTTTVALQLVDEGKIKLTDKLAAFFPKFPGASNITIRMLMNHTSGLFNYTEDDDFYKQFNAGHLKQFTPEELAAFAAKHPPYSAPGAEFHYSNTNTVLLGMIIEKITGSRLADEINARLINKLGLSATYFPKGTDTSGPVVRGYMLENEKYYDWTKMNTSWAWGAGSMISNIYDMKKFVTAVTDGSLLSKQTQDLRMSDWVHVMRQGKPTKTRYGLGIFNVGGYVGHNGGLPGGISYMVRNPQNGIVLVMMMNIQPDDDSASRKILRDVIKVIDPGAKM